MELLRMKPEYIEMTKKDLKDATTRTHGKKFREYELISGDRYRPNKSGVVINIHTRVSWTRDSIEHRNLFLTIELSDTYTGGLGLTIRETNDVREFILNHEDVARTEFKTWEDFIKKLEELNGKKIGIKDMLYTHFYSVVSR